MRVGVIESGVIKEKSCRQLPMLSPLLMEDDTELVEDDTDPLIAFLLWCLAIHRAEQERKRKMH